MEDRTSAGRLHAAICCAMLASCTNIPKAKIATRYKCEREGYSWLSDEDIECALRIIGMRATAALADLPEPPDATTNAIFTKMGVKGGGK